MNTRYCEWISTRCMIPRRPRDHWKEMSSCWRNFAPEVVKMTTYRPANMENLINLRDFSFHWWAMWCDASDLRVFLYSISHKICTRFCRVLFCCGCIVMAHLPMFFRVTSLALGQSYDCPSASDVTLKDMGKSAGRKAQQNKTQASVIRIYDSWGVLQIYMYVIGSWIEEKRLCYMQRIGCYDGQNIYSETCTKQPLHCMVS